MNLDRFNAQHAKRLLLLGLVSLAVVVAGCSSPLIRKGPGPAPAPGTGVKKPGGATVDLGKPGRKLPRAGRRGRGISLVGSCKQTERDGYAEDAKVRVVGGTVTQLDWRIKIPRKGSCRFDGNKFRQTKTSPSVELLAKDGSGCKLLMWTDPRRVTLAHSNCAKFCTRGAYGKAWPVMFNPKSGRCADTRR